MTDGVRWVTSSSSIIMSVMGSMLLRLDRSLHLFFSPLVDTLDFITRLHKFDSKYSFSSGDYAITVVVFTNRFSNFLQQDVRDTRRFWMQFFREHLSACPFSSPELAFVNWLFQPMPEDMFLRCQEALPFLTIVHSEVLLLG